MALKVYVNHTSDDVPRIGNESKYTEINLTNDYFIFSNGSDVVKNGEPRPSEIALTQAGVIIDTVDVPVPHYFLLDASEGEAGTLVEILNAGAKNKMYVFCFSFDAATASEPMLELWDDSGMDTINLYSLGEGDEDDSWWRGIVTTDATPPGAIWEGLNTGGSTLAGATDGHFLRLNKGNGVLTIAKDLYCNLKITTEANFTHAGVEKPIFAIKYTTN